MDCVANPPKEGDESYPLFLKVLLPRTAFSSHYSMPVNVFVKLANSFEGNG